MEYKAYVKQGRGCDYTIACGETVINLISTDMVGARLEMANLLGDYEELSSVVILEVWSKWVMDIDSIYRAIEDRKKRNEKTDKELAEKQEYERLKEKYE